MDVLAHALRYLAAGFSVIPIGAEKRPLFAWKQFQAKRAGEDQARRWWGVAKPPGLAAVCGAISGGLELLDFDHDALATYALWRAMLSEQWPEVLGRVSVVSTPRGGYHVWLRCGDVDVPGNHKLAREARRCLIETRGEGGYALLPGCPGWCHPSGGTYAHHEGCSLESLPSLSLDERDFVLTCARSLDREPAPVATRPAGPLNYDLRPGDDFDRRGWDWADILQPHGWALAGGSAGGERRWRRPDKGRSWSATTGHCSSGGSDLLRVFSSNAAPFEEGKSYGKFRAFALLWHGGDLAAAAKDLAGRNFGTRAAPGRKKANAPPAESVRQDGFNQSQPEVQEPTPVIVHLRDVEALPISWLWKDWMPLGALCVLDGDPGLGKSSLTLDLAARLSRGVVGGAFVGRPVATMLLGAEDSLAHTVRPRLDAMDADCNLVHAFEGMLSDPGKPDDVRPVVLPGDLKRLAETIAKLNVRLVVIDPLMAYLGTEYDAHKDQDVRRCLRPMAQLAEQLQITILLVRHLNKLSGGPALYRGGSSIGITGAARASLIVGRDPDCDRHVLAMNKVNAAARPRSIAYRLEGRGMACRIVWEEEVDLRADQILGHGPPRHEPGQGGRASGAGRPPDALEAARRFLADLLCGGPVETADVMKAAAEQQIARNTLDRARADLGVVPFRQGKTFMMRLPQNAAGSGPGAQAQDSGGGVVDPDAERDATDDGDDDCDVLPFD